MWVTFDIKAPDIHTLGTRTRNEMTTHTHTLGTGFVTCLEEGKSKSASVLPVRKARLLKYLRSDLWRKTRSFVDEQVIPFWLSFGVPNELCQMLPSSCAATNLVETAGTYFKG